MNSSLVSVVIPASDANFTYGRSGRTLRKITVHHCAGVMSCESIGYLWQNPNRECSSHYGIGNDGRIGQYVDEANTAWTDSNWDSNCSSVTIETSNCATGGDWPVGDAALNSLIQLCADIAIRNNLGFLTPGDNLTWHSMYAATQCPGDYLRARMQYIADEANKIISGGGPTPTPQEVNTYYRVRTQADGWLPEVKNCDDYAGWQDSPITDIAIKVDKGSIQYRVHVKGGNWLGWVTGYDLNDSNNGYAGTGKPIDAIQIYYYTPNDIRPYKKAMYKVNDYSWQYDTETGGGQDGYAGCFGYNITKVWIKVC